VFERVGLDNDVFFMVPPYSDKALIEESDNGLVWHMLSGAEQLSVSFQPLFEMAETHLRTFNTIPSGTNNMRVAIVVGEDQRFLTEMRDYIDNNVTINGALVKENGTETVQTFSIQSSYTNSEGVGWSDTVQQILDFAPHIVLGLTTDEAVTDFIPLIENGWDAANGPQDPPFYILSPLDYNLSTAMPYVISQDTTATLFKRVIGINWPAAEDQTIYDAYQTRFYDRNHINAPFYDNYYDAAYYLLYGVAASYWPVRGSSIIDGLIQVTTGTTEVAVGPGAEMQATVNALKSGGTKFKIIGAMGPPNWDSKGSRQDPATVWCIDQWGAYYPDRLRYNSSSMTLEGSTWSAFCNYDFPAP